MHSVWSLMREHLSARLSEQNFKIWIDPIQPQRIDGDVLHLGCPNRFFLAWVREHYLEQIQSTLDALKSCGMAVQRVELEQANAQLPARHPQPPAGAAQPELPNLEAFQRAPLRFNRRFTFDRFVVGSNSQYAYSATQALAMGQSLNTNALYLLSDPGLGKSHLAQALGHFVLSQNGSTRVYYLTAEDFTNEMVHSIKNQSMEDFKRKYRQGCDVLVLEEVHFLGGKEKVQSELSYTLDHLYENRKKVIFTSSKLPRDIPRMGRQLSSRLTTSLISTIEHPDFETRLKILEKKSREHGIAAPVEVLEYIAENVKKDVRQMESCLFSLDAKCKLLNRPVDLRMAEETLADLIEVAPKASLEAILDQICRYYSVSLDDLKSRSRRKNLVWSRNIGMFLTRKGTSLSLDDIGLAFGRNHSTVLYAVNLVENRRLRDPKLKGQVEFLGKKLGLPELGQN